MILRILSFLTLGNESYFSTTNLHNDNITLPGGKYHFRGNLNYDASSQDYTNLVKKIKKLDIFAYKVDDINVKTIIHRNNSDQDIKLDDEIAVTTTSLSDSFFTTSFEKICVLQETENSLLLCITANSQNIIDGYYRIYVTYNNGKITIDYTKVQNPITWFFKSITFFFKQKYVDLNTESVKNTMNYLSERTLFKIEDVKFEIK
jgi:hypothetical protein